MLLAVERHPAMLLAWLLDSVLPRTPQGTAAGAAILVFPMLQMLAVSFGVPYQSSVGGYARRFGREDWHHDEILHLIAADGGRGLLVGVDRAALNANNLELTATALQLPFSIETTAHENDLETLKQRLAQTAFFLFKEGGEPESPAFNPYASDLARSVSADREFQRIPYDRLLPDGGSRASKPAEGRNDAVCKGACRAPMSLRSISVECWPLRVSPPSPALARRRSGRGRCLRSPEREYWCFTHLIDRSNRIVAQLDHRLLGGQPPERALAIVARKGFAATARRHSPGRSAAALRHLRSSEWRSTADQSAPTCGLAPILTGGPGHRTARAELSPIRT